MPTGIPLPATVPLAAASSPGFGWYAVDGGILGTPPPTQFDVLPMWHDLDFQRTSTGRLLAAVVPHAQDGHGGQLQVWQYDDEAEPNATTHVVVVPSDVYGAALVVLPSDVLEVWYLLGATSSTPRRRVSFDLGLTWGEETVYDLGLAVYGDDPPYIYPAPAYAPPLPATGNVNGGHPLSVAYHPQKGKLGLLLLGRLPDTETRGVFFATAGRSEDGAGWEFETKLRLTVNTGIPSNLQAVPDGTFLLLPGFVRLPASSASAVAPLAPLLPPVDVRQPLGSNTAAWYDYRRGLALLKVPVQGPAIDVHFRPVEPAYSYLDRSEFAGLFLYALEDAREWRWEKTGEWADHYGPNENVITEWLPYQYPTHPCWSAPGYTGTVREWRLFAGEPVTADYPPGITPDFYYYPRARMLRQRSDAVYEYLRPVPVTGELQFARCQMLKRDAHATWTGKGEW